MTAPKTPWHAAEALPLFQALSAAEVGDFMPILLQTLKLGGNPISIRLLLADVEERILKVWGHSGMHPAPRTRRVAIEGSAHGKVYRTGTVSRTEIDGHPGVLAPITARRERIGVLEVLLGDPVTEDMEAAVSTAELILGYLITSADRWTDEFHVARRRKDMTLAAEIQWNLLPLAAVSTDRASLACALEPAYEVGGDAFDYSYGRKVITIGIFDAMGRGVNASWVSALGVSAFRNARRCRRDLTDQARFIHQSLEDRFDESGFMTGQLVAVNLDDPRRSLIVNAGHPAPFLQREADILRPDLQIDLPFGIPLENPLMAQPLELHRGDRLILISDGMVEARPDGGEVFGYGRLVEALGQLQELSARETARRLIAEVRAHRAGDLTDDATLIVLDLAP